MDPNETLKMIDDFLRAHKSGEEVDQWCRDLLAWLDKGGIEPDWDKYGWGTGYFKCRVIEESRAKPPWGAHLKNACSKCGEDLILKRTRWGAPFYGCSKWPRCRGSQKYPPEICASLSYAHGNGEGRSEELAPLFNDVTITVSMKDGEFFTIMADNIKFETTREVTKQYDDPGSKKFKLTPSRRIKTRISVTEAEIYGPPC